MAFGLICRPLRKGDFFSAGVWRPCNLTAFLHSSTGPVVHPFASRHEGPGFNPQGGYLCETGILLLACLATGGNMNFSKFISPAYHFI
jgi:hypothetical protein